MNPADAIHQLIAADWTEAKIAETVGTTQPTINRIKRGASPSYEVGVRIVALAVGHTAAQPPMHPAQPEASVHGVG